MADSRWVTFGGSYPGNLATWLKLKYPGLTAGTVGSSAPVFAQYDFYQYGQVVGAALANPAIGGSPRCAAAVGAGVDALVARGPVLLPPAEERRRAARASATTRRISSPADVARPRVLRAARARERRASKT